MGAVSRRGFLAGAAGMAVAGAAGAGAVAAFDRGTSQTSTSQISTSQTSAMQATGAAPPPQRAPDPLQRAVEFYGPHQAGITTTQQRHLLFATFDVTTPERQGLTDLLRAWTAAAAALCSGSYGASRPRDEPPADSGEAGTAPAGLTLTVGFGTSLFTLDGSDRFGLAARAPRHLVELPSFLTDRLVPERCGGDLCVQACADDPLVPMHAIRTLRRVAGSAVSLRWTQTGFVGGPPGPEPRNLFGFKDGTANPTVGVASVADDVVWVGDDDVPWLAGGSYLVARRIHMRVEKWDSSSLADQEATIGRRKASGAPLSGRTDRDPPDFTARTAAGGPAIPATAHIRLAAPQHNGGAQLLRRGYTFCDGDDHEAEFESGLMFLCYQRDPERQFLPIASRLSAHDALNEYVVHTGSGVFACPPGTRAGEWWGQALFES